LWGEAFYHAVWLKNRTSTRALGVITPYERLHGHKPNLGSVPEWGQWVWVHNSKGTKLDARGVMGRWVGYDRDSPHAHQIYWPEKHSISVERDVKLTTDALIVYAPPAQISSTPPATTSQPSTPQPTATTTPDDGGQESPEQASAPDNGAGEPPRPATPNNVEQVGADEPPPSPLTALPRTPSPHQPPPAPKKQKTTTTLPVRQLTRASKPSSYVQRLAEGEGSADGRGGMPGGIPNFKWTHPDWQERQEHSFDSAYTAELDDAAAAAIGDVHGDPRTIDKAWSRANWPSWKAAMDRKIETLRQAGTWETVPRPTSKNVVSCKWVFRIKRKADGSIDKYKVRLVARGFTQVYGVDYFAMFSPVAKLSSFRAVLAIAARNDWEVDLFDFNGAYLNGELDEGEEIYMQEPPGYEEGQATVK
jgi:Reverse transcriptase (RNA-dependent DNA polymerase)